MKNILLFTIALLYNLTSYSQAVSPSDIIGVCSNQNIVNPTPTGTKYNNLITHCSTIPLTNTLVLYYVEIMSGTTFAFTITPTNDVDYDFATWLNPNINNLGPADRGSQNSPLQTGVYTVGLSLHEPIETCELPSANISGLIPGMVRYYDVQPGDAILIAVNRWSTKDSGFTLSFEGDAILNCILLDKAYHKCDFDNDGKENFDLTEIADEIKTSDPTYVVDFFASEIDANNATATNTLPSNHTAYTASNPNSIYARVKRPNGILKKVMKIDLIVDKSPVIKQKKISYESCDYDRSGTVSFDLTSMQPTIANGQTDLQFKYYENLSDAEDNNNKTIVQPQKYVSGLKTVYIRVAINDKCAKIVEADLILIYPPTLLETEIEYELCEREYTEKAIFDLTSQEKFIANNQKDLVFKYYENLVDAEQDNANFISTPTSYTAASRTVYTRVSIQGKCALTATLNLIVDSNPRVTDTQFDYEICDDDLDGMETFDLKSYESIIVSDPTGIEFKYYKNLTDAQNNSAAVISNTKEFTSKKTTVYVRITLNQKCPILVALNLIPSRTTLSSSETRISEICGEEHTDGLRFNLTRALTSLLKGEQSGKYKISYYREEEDARNANNALENYKSHLVAYGTEETVYVRFENGKGCYIISHISLESNRRITIPDQYNKECDPYQLPVLPEAYAYYTQPHGPRGTGTRIDPKAPESSSIFGKRLIYIYASSKGEKDLVDKEKPDADECIFETSFTVFNNDCKIPKGISPNGDGKNDSWDLTPFGVTDVVIFNRWGQEVYQFSGNYINQWYGQSSSGKELPDGTYWYSLETLNGKLQGWVQIMR